LKVVQLLMDQWLYRKYNYLAMTINYLMNIMWIPLVQLFRIEQFSCHWIFRIFSIGKKKSYCIII